MKIQLYLLLLLSCTYRQAVVAQVFPPCNGSPSQVPPGEECNDICIYCPLLGGYAGSTDGYMANPGPPGGFCSSIEDDLWIGFITGQNKSGTITITPSNCLHGNGLEAALYERCSAPPIACVPGQAGGGSTPVSLSANFISGKNYFLMIDGYAGDVCDFVIGVSPAEIFTAPFIDSVPPIQGPSQACAGSMPAYTIPEVSGAGYYTWQSTTPGVLFNGEMSPSTFEAPAGRAVKITFPTYLISPVSFCVQPSNSCHSGDQRCKTVNVKPPPKTILPWKQICMEDWNGQKDSVQHLISWLGCDSVVVQNVLVIDILPTNLGAKYICEGDSITICGQDYKNSGPISKTCLSYLGCDSIVTANVFILSPMAEIQPNNKALLSLSCKTPQIFLNSAPSPPITTKIWRNGKGKLVGTGNSLVVNTPGIYTLTSAQTLGGVICTKTASVEVISRTLPPLPITLTASPPLVPGEPYVQLKAKSLSAGLKFNWTGPKGFKSAIQDPVVSTPGFYTVVGTNPETGCTTSATIEVPKM